MRFPVLSPHARALALADQRRVLGLGDPATDCAAKGGLVNSQGICCTQGYDKKGVCFVKLPSGEITSDPAKVSAALAQGYVPSVADPFVLVLASSGGGPSMTTPGSPCGQGGTTGPAGECCPFGTSAAGRCLFLLPDGTKTDDAAVATAAVVAGGMVNPLNPYQIMKGPGSAGDKSTTVVTPKASVVPWVIAAALAAGAVYYVATTSRPPTHPASPHGGYA